MPTILNPNGQGVTIGLGQCFIGNMCPTTCFVVISINTYIGNTWLFFSIRLLLHLRGHSFFSSPPQRPMTSDFKGFSIQDFIHYIFFSYLNSSERASISILMLSVKQGNYWYHFYYVFGMTRSLSEDWTRDLPHSKPAL